MRRAAQCLFRTLETTRHFTSHVVVVCAQTLGIKRPTLKSLGALDNGSQSRGVYMKGFKFVALAAFVGCAMIATVPKANAQIAVEIGVAPECPYGYYDAAPYECAPYGYYGPEWFTGGVFSALAHGFMVLTTSADTSTIVFIRNTAIADQATARGESGAFKSP
jgi:hypothetical protein